MPELPEVETVRKTLERAILGKRIRSLEVSYPKMIHHDLSDFEKSVQNGTFIAVERRGKYLILKLDNGFSILSHLRMEGKYRLEKGTPAFTKHDRICFRFFDDSSLFYNDVRKFGVYELFRSEDIYKEPPLSLLGPEPFDMKDADLYAKLRKRKGPVKEALLDQSLIAGIGNIYADETLFRSHIHPLREMKSLSAEECHLLLKNAKEVLKEAIALGGSTVRSYHPSEGIDGKMQTNLLAYGRVGAPCPYCALPLKKIRVGGRGTTFCPHCQKDPKAPFVLGLGGPIASGKSTLSSYLKTKGYLHLDADKIVHDLYENPSFARRLAKIFGKDILTEKGTIDRKKLLFSLSKDKEGKKKLEALVHPAVYRKCVSFLKKAKGEKVLLDVPLLFDSPFESLCDATILLFAEPEIQRERLALRGVDVEASLKLNSSFPLEYAKKHASLVLKSTSAPFEETREKLEKVAWL